MKFIKIKNYLLNTDKIIYIKTYVDKDDPNDIMSHEVYNIVIKVLLHDEIETFHFTYEIYKNWKEDIQIILDNINLNEEKIKWPF